jgi:hypothetical protein
LKRSPALTYSKTKPSFSKKDFPKSHYYYGLKCVHRMKRDWSLSKAKEEKKGKIEAKTYQKAIRKQALREN